MNRKLSSFSLHLLLASSLLHLLTFDTDLEVRFPAYDPWAADGDYECCQVDGIPYAKYLDC